MLLLAAAAGVGGDVDGCCSCTPGVSSDVLLSPAAAAATNCDCTSGVLAAKASAAVKDMLRCDSKSVTDDLALSICWIPAGDLNLLKLVLTVVLLGVVPPDGVVALDLLHSLLGLLPITVLDQLLLVLFALGSLMGLPAAAAAASKGTGMPDPGQDNALVLNVGGGNAGSLDATADGTLCRTLTFTMILKLLLAYMGFGRLPKRRPDCVLLIILPRSMLGGWRGCCSFCCHWRW